MAARSFRHGALVSGALWLGLAGGAQAGLEICNDTSVVQTVAIGFKGDTDWMSEGWWNIDPGDCALVLAGDLTRRYYYYYAESSNNDFVGQDFRFCGTSEVFSIIGDTTCEDRGYETLSMREIDTGESALAFTVRLVDDRGVPSEGGKIAPKIDEDAPDTEDGPGDDGPKKPPEGPVETSTTGPGGPGGGTPITEVVQDTTIVAPEEVPMSISVDDLRTDIPAGNHGKGFETAALFQGCELEDRREYCSFHAGDWKMRVFYRGPTPENLMFALEALAVNMPVYLKGDMVETKGNVAAIVVRAVEPRPGDDPDSRLRAAIQGTWTDQSDRGRDMTLQGSEVFYRRDGGYETSRFFRIAHECSGGSGEGPFLVQINPENNRRICYRIGKADGRVLELTDVQGGGTTTYIRQ